MDSGAGGGPQDPQIASRRFVRTPVTIAEANDLQTARREWNVLLVAGFGGCHNPSHCDTGDKSAISSEGGSATESTFVKTPTRSFLLGMLPISVGLLAFYWISAVTTVGGGNWGEFQTFGYQGGIPHSPGFPLLTASIYFGTHLLKFLEPTHAANVVNGTFAAAAGVLLFAAAWKLSGSWMAALLTTTVFATGYSVWEHAVQAEMMSLQAALVLGVVVTLLRYDSRPSASRLALVAFATGLSLTNHGISLFMVPATVGFIALKPYRGLLRPKSAFLSLGAFLLGLLPWLYFLRALFMDVTISRPENWRHISFDEAVYLVVRKPLLWVSSTDAVENPLAEGSQAILAEWPRFAHDALREFGWIWVGAAGLGWLLLVATRSRLAAWCLWTAATTLWFALSTSPLLDVDRYFVVIYCVAAICLAVTLGFALRLVRRLARGLRGTRPARMVMPMALSILLVIAGLRAWEQLSGPTALNIQRHRENAEEQYILGEGIVRHSAPNSVFMTNWTSSWYPRYVIYVKGLNTGLEVKTTDYWTMGIEQADKILGSGRRLYLQRSREDYESRYRVLSVEGVFFEVVPRE